MTLPEICIFGGGCLVGWLTAVFATARNGLSIGRVRAISAGKPVGERACIVIVEGESGKCRVVMDDAQAAFVSERLLYLAATLTPRETSR